MEYSTEQLLAIETTGTNLLLSAAAGSGKTHTLVARILHLIEQGANVDEMLIITFTRAAAAEMRSRLIERLSKRAQQLSAPEDAALQRRLYDQLRRAEYASIQTIDAFCADVLRAHFEAAGADPLFRVPDDAELRQIEARAFEDALEATYLASDDRLRALHFGRKVPQLASLTAKLFRFAENRPDPDGWLGWAVEQLPAAGSEIWFDELHAAARRALREAHALLLRAVAVCEAPEGPMKYRATMAGDVELIAPLLDADYDGLCLSLDALAFARMPSVGDKGLSEREIELRDQVKALRTDAKKGVDKARGLLMPRDLALADIAQNQPAMEQLLKLTRAFARRREELMAERSQLSFSDIQHRALIALSDPNVADSQQARFAHVFVDEYQDVSELQEAIIAKVARGDNLFMVGDVKQSIYRFRQAEPSLFIGKYRRYGARDGGMLIPLSKNYRSRASILEFTNAVFERVMTGGEREIEYDRDARLVPGADFVGDDPPVELALLLGEAHVDAPPEAEADEPSESDNPDRDQDDPEERPSAAELNQAGREGAFIAARILALRGTDHYDAKAKAMRPLGYRDFAVLLRSRTHMKAIEAQLKRAGIPVYADVATGYLDALEVRILLALLTVIENRRRDKELLIALRSPIVGLSSVDLAAIRAKHLAGSYRDAMLAYMDLGDELAQTLRAFEDRLDRWRALSRALPLTILIDTVLRESRFYAIAGELPAGEARQANLDLLITYAADFDAAQDGALTGFLRYVRRIEKSLGDMATAHTLGEGDDVVMLTTVHKSKGLEYPVVLAPMMDKALLRPERDAPLFLHRELGAALPLHDVELGTRRKTVAQRAIGERNRLEALNEEMRILYVLMTRAVDRLILIGSVKDAGAQLRRWQAFDPAMTPKSFLDLIAPPMIGALGDADILASRDAEAAVGGARARLRLVDASGLVLPAPDTADASEDSDSDQALLESFRRAIDWRYPYADQVLLPLKLTATGVAREWTGPTAATAITRRPRFLTGDDLSATERGSLIHAALMGLDLGALRGLSGAALTEELDRQLAHMLETGKLYAKLDAALIFDFLSGELGQRLLSAERVQREWAFNLNMTLRETMAADSDQRVLVQGVIDCCFLEDGRWVLLDYKTDRPGDIDALCAHYKPQLDLYAAALERITNTPVSTRILCLLRARRNIEL